MTQERDTDEPHWQDPGSEGQGLTKGKEEVVGDLLSTDEDVFGDTVWPLEHLFPGYEIRGPGRFEDYTPEEQAKMIREFRGIIRRSEERHGPPGSDFRRDETDERS